MTTDRPQDAPDRDDAETESYRAEQGKAPREDPRDRMGDVPLAFGSGGVLVGPTTALAVSDVATLDAAHTLVDRIGKFLGEQCAVPGHQDPEGVDPKALQLGGRHTNRVFIAKHFEPDTGHTLGGRRDHLGRVPPARREIRAGA